MDYLNNEIRCLTLDPCVKRVRMTAWNKGHADYFRAGSEGKDINNIFKSEEGYEYFIFGIMAQGGINYFEQNDRVEFRDEKNRFTVTIVYPSFTVDRTYSITLLRDPLD